jgi:hypothetical protein
MTPTAGWDRQTIRRDCADPSLLPGNCLQLHVLFRDTSYAGVMTNTIRETGRRRLRPPVPKSLLANSLFFLDSISLSSARFILPTVWPGSGRR